MTTDRKYDIVIVGGGPAGLTAGLYAGRARVKTAILERGAPGGQLLNTEAIEDYPGFDHVTGTELAQRMAEQARKFGVDVETTNVTAIRNQGDRKVVDTESGSYSGDFVILAAGGEPKKLGIPGEAEYQGRGVSQCAVCDGAFFKEQEVAVVGGGDAAVEEAAFLTRYAKKVYLIHRRPHFRAQAILIEAARKNPKIEIILNTTVSAVHGDDGGVTGITIRDGATGRERQLALTGFFVFIGFQPNVQFFDHREHPKHDPLNFLLTDANMETSVPGVYAVGDVRSQLTRQITTAVGDATTAAIDAVKKLEAKKHQLTPVPVDAYGEADSKIIPAH
ncbi:MAG TPA: thioredoxin-disulfide reductase [Candidatus Limnocylindrales bacterium]|nr:thioredoxin-disulfide reductase [Candidatus Limnocylindrales bacterium]